MSKETEYYNLAKKNANKYESYKISYLKLLHDRIIRDEAKLIDDLSPIKEKEMYMAIYYYLLWNGYFSAEKKFTATIYPDELKVDKSISIANGNGCCRNITPHFMRILRLLEPESSIALIGTKSGFIPNILKDIPEIKRNIDISCLNITPRKDESRKDYPDHVELFHYPTSTILDPYNFTIQQYKYSNKPSGNKKLISFAAGMILDYEMNDETRKQMYEASSRIEKLFNDYQMIEMSTSQLDDLRYMGVGLCKRHEDLLENYSIKMDKSYQMVKSLTPKYRNKGF